MLGASLTHDGDELLDRSVPIADYLARGKTTGIPLLHPWANRLDGEHYSAAGREVTLPPGLPHEANGLPIHGVLPQAFTVDDTATHDGCATLDASLEFAHDAFPFPHRLEQHVVLEHHRLAIETVITPSADQAVPVSFGFHPYLRLPGLPRAQWLVELPMRRHLLVDERLIPTGEGEHESTERELLGERAFDDGYDGLASEPRFVVRGGGREIVVRLLSGYSAAQIYAPPGRDVICFEPMTAPTNTLVSGFGLQLVAPGEEFHALFEIQVARVAA
jgi:aldose 1-epimerase